jgi:hypothetical protein
MLYIYTWMSEIFLILRVQSFPGHENVWLQQGTSCFSDALARLICSQLSPLGILER